MSEIVRELLELQAREGWLSPASLEALADRLRIPLHRLESVSTFYTHFEREPPQGRVIEVCRDLSCRMAGSQKACAAVRRVAEQRGDAIVREVSCLGRCDSAPAAAVGDFSFDARDEAGLRTALGPSPGGKGPARDRAPRSWPTVDPYVADGRSPRRPLYSVLGAVLEEGPGGTGEKSGGEGPQIKSRELIGRIETAGLRGMGGAGFPTARKWTLVADAPGDEKHVVCNADESEPGTFKDREILFDLPHLVIEGVLLAGFCVGAQRGTIFIRHEYGPERQRLESAIAEARALGAIGENIFGSGFDFDLDIFVSPGGYILGEETALLECMEGRRGEPRNKPPFPGVSGLYGRPTVINNVETLVHAVGIVEWGSDWWQGLGRPGFAGHKFVSTSGDVQRPGVELFAVGTPIREILLAHGGMRDGKLPLAVAPGGASSSFLGEEALDIPLDFDRLSAAGSMLGSGAVVFIEQGRNLLEVGLSIARFFRNESCGKCVPCRVGSEKAVSLLEAAGSFNPSLQATIQELHETMKNTSICGLGQVALSPLLSIASRFPDEVRGDLSE